MSKPIKVQFADESVSTSRLRDFLFKHFDLEISDTPDFLICSTGGLDYRRYQCIRIFHSNERSRLDLCNYDFTFSMSPDSAWNYYCPDYFLFPMYSLLFERKNVDELMKEKTKFCNFVYSRGKAKTLLNNYPGVAYRNEFFHRLSEYRRVDSYGRALNNMGRSLPGCGGTPDFYRPYKFTIAFENSACPGYVTEKISNALAGMTVPIYWGASAHEQFNSKAFINCRDYDNWDAVIERVIQVDKDDDLYKRYLSEPAFADGCEPEFLKETNIVARFSEIFGTREKLREQHLFHRPRAAGRHFLRWLAHSSYKWLKTSDGY